MSRRFLAYIALCAALLATLSPASISAVQEVNLPSTPPPGGAAAAAQELAGRILFPSDPGDAAEAVSEAVSWSGISTIGTPGTVRLGVTPAIPLSIDMKEARSLAFDAAGRVEGGGRMTLDELADTLHTAGWEVPSGQEPGSVLLEALRGMIKEAHKNPQWPHSFVPLFIEEMTAYGQPYLDLNDEYTSPYMVELSLLEVQLFLAMHVRPPGEGLGAMGLWAPSIEWAETAHADGMTPCSDLLDKFGDWKWLSSFGLDKLSGMPVGAGYESMGIKGPGPQIVTLLIKVLKTLNQTGTIGDNLRFKMTASPDEQHYNHQISDGMEAAFTATVQWVDEYEDDPNPDVQRMRADCLSSLGFPVADSQNMIAKQMSNWVVVWEPSGLGKHAVIGKLGEKNDFSRHAGGLATQITGNQSGGSANLVVDMATESQDAVDNPSDKERTAPVRMVGKLDMSEMPDPSILIKAALGGSGKVEELADALLEVMTGFYKKVGTPKARAAFTAVWHEPAGAGWSGTVTLTKTTRWQSTETRPAIYDGESTVQAANDSNLSAVMTVTAGKPGKPSIGKVMAEYTETFASREQTTGSIDCGSEVWMSSRSNPKSFSYGSETRLKTSASVEDETTIDVTIEEDGTYWVTMWVPDLEGKQEGMATSFRKGYCDNISENESQSLSDSVEVHGGIWTARGKVDPGDPDTISGQHTFPPIGDSGVTVMSWSLSRD